MAATIYELFFGTANAGQVPTWARFSRTDTHAALPQPAFTEIGNGLYSFQWDWATSPTPSVEYVATCNGAELADTLTNTQDNPLTITVGTGSYNWNGYQTAGTIVNRAAIQAGLKVRPDPFDGVDPDFILLVEALTALGDDLTQQYEWTHLQREATFTTDGVSTSYLLPSDFSNFTDQSGWNRSMRFPLIGPLTPQQRQFLKARLPSIVVQVTFVIEGNKMTFPIVPPNGTVVAFEYQSTNWVRSAGGTSPDLAAPGNKDDLILMDPLLSVYGAKLGFLKARGFDTTLAQTDFDSRLERAIGKNTGAPVLNLGGGRNVFERPIDGWNVPAGNWGL